MKTYDDKREQQINALLNGELAEPEADKLKTAAA